MWALIEYVIFTMKSFKSNEDVRPNAKSVRNSSHVSANFLLDSSVSALLLVLKSDHFRSASSNLNFKSFHLKQRRVCEMRVVK